MPLRLKDVAKKLNVSPATVSLVINNKPGVGKETRQRVLQALAEMGYEPTILQKSALNNSNNKNIRFIIYKKHGLVVSDTPFFSALMEGIDQEARKNGYNLVISYMNEKENREEILRIIEESPLDGIIILATEMRPEDLQEFKKLPVPIVVLDSYFKEEKVDTVIINNIQGAYEATKYLISMGHTEIGYLHSSVWINNFDEREEGFIKALNEHNIKFNKKYVFSLESTLEGSYRDMLKLLESRIELPTACFADNDIIAFGAIKALKEKGVKLAKDISIVGFDDMPFCEMTEPPLTTIRVYKQSMGRLAVKRLIEKINDRSDIVIKMEVATELVERKSVIKI